MAPFYEQERRLSTGEQLEIHTDPKRARVFILSNNSALVDPDGSWAFVGPIKKKDFRSRMITTPVKVTKESISTLAGSAKVIWRKK